MITRILLVAAVGLSLGACTKKDANTAGCVVQNAVTNTVAVAIAQELQCEDQAAIQAALNDAASKVGICQSEKALAIGKKPDLKSIGGDICNTVAGRLIDSLVAGTIPSDWKCSGGAATSALSGFISAACAKAFP